MKLIQYLIIISSCILLNSNIQAQETLKQRQTAKADQHLGASFGGMSGHGLSYRITHGKTMIQISYAPFIQKKLVESTIGFAFMYKIAQRKNSSLFLYSGQRFITNNYYNRNNPFKYFEIDDSENISWNVGFGAGIEFIIMKNISICLMGGYCSYDELENIKLVFESGIFYKL